MHVYKHIYTTLSYQLEGGDPGRVSGHLEVHRTCIHMRIYMCGYEYICMSIYAHMSIYGCVMLIS